MYPASDGCVDEPEPEMPEAGRPVPHAHPGSGGAAGLPAAAADDPAVQAVSFWMRVENTDCHDFMRSAEANAKFQAAIKASIVAETGFDLQPSDVDLHGHPLLLQVVIDVPVGVSACSVRSKLDTSSSLPEAVAAEVNRCLQGAGEPVASPIYVSNVSCATIATVFDGVWKKDCSAYSIKDGLLRFPSGGQAEINIVTAESFDIWHTSGITLVASLDADRQCLTWSNGSVWYASDHDEEGQEQEEKDSVDAAAGKHNVKPQAVNGAHVYPQHWGITKAQCRELLRELRQDPTWDSQYSMHTLVKSFIVPRTQGTGASYALSVNRDSPREANVFVVFAWAQNAEEFFEAVERSTAERDVLFICALSMYQAEDDAGPSIAEQLGDGAARGAFEQVLDQIHARGDGGGHPGWWRVALDALPGLLLAGALVLLFGPVIAWGCVPSHDMSRCAVRTPGRLMWSQSSYWSWLPQYEHDWARAPPWMLAARGRGYAAVAALALGAALIRLVLYRCDFYAGRVLVVPSHKVAVSRRLWCVAHIVSARKLRIPVVIANTLAPVGRCRSEAATCSNRLDEPRVWEDIEGKMGTRKCCARIDRDVGAIALRHRWAQRCMLLKWGLLLALFQCADLCLVSLDNQALNAGHVALPFSALGIVVGVFSSAWAIYFICWVARGAPSPRALCLSIAALAGAALAICVALASVGATRHRILEHWTGIADLISDVGYRYVDTERCGTGVCQRATAFAVALAQTWIIGGVNFVIFLCGAFCSPAWLKEHPCAIGTTGVAALLVVTLALVATRTKYGAGGPAHPFPGIPGPQDPFALVVFHLTQVCARCMIPLGAMWACASCWGVSLAKGQGHGGGRGKPGKGGRCCDDDSVDEDASVAGMRYTVFV